MFCHSCSIVVVADVAQAKVVQKLSSLRTRTRCAASCYMSRRAFIFLSECLSLFILFPVHQNSRHTSGQIGHSCEVVILKCSFFCFVLLLVPKCACKTGLMCKVSVDHKTSMWVRTCI